jgi:hypothetical protein
MTDAELASMTARLVPPQPCTPQCPDADTLTAFALGQLDSAERDAIAERVGACPNCAAAVQLALASGDWSADLARDLEAESDSAQVVTLTPRPRRRMPLWIPAAMAAGVALVFVALPMLRPPVPGQVLRGAAALAVQPADESVLHAAPDELRWPCALAPNAVQVELLDASAVRLWIGQAEDCSATLPAEVKARVNGGAYLWRLSDTREEVVAGPFGFSVDER